MKNIGILICILFVLTGCQKKSEKENNFEHQIQLVGKIEFNDEINDFVIDFMKSINNQDCIYEIYIDKKTEDEYFLTLFNEPNEPNYLSNRFPVNYTLINGKYVFVYSGIEDFVKKDEYRSKLKFSETSSKIGFKAETVSKVILKDTSYIAGEVGLPFSNLKSLPPVIYKAPE